MKKTKGEKEEIKEKKVEKIPTLPDSFTEDSSEASPKEKPKMSEDFGVLYNFENDRFVLNKKFQRPLKITKLKKAVKLLKTINKNLKSLYASYDYVQLKVASADRIQAWGNRVLPEGIVLGELDSADTLDFKDLTPLRWGLFSEVLFGPLKNYHCDVTCRKYKGFSFQKICDVCFVEITDSRVRRYRLAYLELALPIIHFWYFTTSPNYLKILLSFLDEIRPISMEEIKSHIYYAAPEYNKKPQVFGIDLAEQIWMIYSERKSSLRAKYGLKKKVYASEIPNFQTLYYYKKKTFKSFYSGLYSPKAFASKSVATRRFGSALLQAALEDLDLLKRITHLRKKLEEKNYQHLSTSRKYTKEILILESFLATKTHPSFLVFTHFPVLPPGLRPIIELPDGLLVSADQNEMYRKLIHRNNTLYSAPIYDIPINQTAKRLLQESTDILLDNARSAKPLLDKHNKPLKSLTEILEGKEGRFRQNLLGKRVDYSGRSVIIVGPHLSLNECGIPFQMAIKLFGALLISETIRILITRGPSRVNKAKSLIKMGPPAIWWIMVKMFRYYSVFLNRAPTLHKFGVQAFDPVLVLDKAIHLHPLVCSGFNADFDGDQMALHLPLLPVSQFEIKTMMRPSHNLFSPATGELLVKPTQDMIIGSYYLTLLLPDDEAFTYSNLSSRIYATESEVLSALKKNYLSLHSQIFLRVSMEEVDIRVNDNNSLSFSPTSSSFSEEPIYFFEEHKSEGKLRKTFFFTSIGIFIGRYTENNLLYITDALLETTPGRVIIGENFKKTEKYSLSLPLLSESFASHNLRERKKVTNPDELTIVYEENS